MSSSPPRPSRESPAWAALRAHRAETDRLHVSSLFAEDPERFAAFSLEAGGARGGVLLDYAKNRVTTRTMSLLADLARERNVEGWRDRMFAGEKINDTENRAVLHTALRLPETGPETRPAVRETLRRMESFSAAVRGGRQKGGGGRPFTDVVNIGIGGSDLGPKMVCRALKPFCADGPAVHFVSNIDGCHLGETLERLDPETTLFLLASKTFTTQETMTNAQAAKAWVLRHFGDERKASAHFAALTANGDAATAFGIAPATVFAFEDWVGGRFSLWSAAGLSICLAAGFGNFCALLDGAHDMDRHFREAPLERNMPAVLGLLGVWYRNFWNAASCAVLPYSQRLEFLPAWLQQVDMESNGKSVCRDGAPAACATGPVVFGAAGTDGQHAFYQLLHQGTDLIPCDFIGFAEPAAYGDNHRALLANMLAQSRALMEGRSAADSGDDTRKAFDGNKPSNTILLRREDPYHLGLLLALYEHKIFVQGIIWNINSFDQWGVELGKIMARSLLSVAGPGETDGSTAGLLEYINGK